MAVTWGKDILVKVSTTTVGYTDNQSLAFNCGSEEVTTFGDLFKASIATIKDVAFSFSGTLDLADAGQTLLYNELLTGDCNIANMRLYISSSYFSGAAVISNFTIAGTAGGKVTYSASCTGTGTWSLT